MLDIVSSVASIICVVNMANHVLSRSFQYTKALMAALNDMKNQAPEIRLLSVLLHDVSLVATEIVMDTVERNLRLRIDSSRESLRKIERRFKNYDPTIANDKPIKAALRNLNRPTGNPTSYHVE